MSSNKYATPLKIDLNSSPRLTGFIIATHGLALLVVFLIPVSLWKTILLAFVITTSFVLVLNKYGRLTTADAITALVWGADGVWSIKQRNGVEYDARLSHDGYLHPSLVILSLVIPGHRPRRRVVITPDAVGKETFRRLCVRLRTEI